MVRFEAPSTADFLLLDFGIFSSAVTKRCGKLHSKMSVLGNYLVVISPELMSTLQPSKC